MGVQSTLLPRRRRDLHREGFHEWPFMTVHNWGEDPRGNWKYTVALAGSETQATLQVLTVILFGVMETPRSVRDVPSTCHPECQGGCAGEGPQFCDTCRNYQLAETFECVSRCPVGTYVDHHMCRPCPPFCRQCDKDQCLSCVEDAVVLTSGECSSSCEPSMYLSPGGQCQPCHHSCLECNGSTNTSCTLCPPQFIRREDGYCAVPPSCQESEYFDSRSLECRPCHESCAECVGKGVKECTACFVGFVLEDGVCTVAPSSSKQCPSGQYFDEEGEGCEPCSTDCGKCTDEIMCLSCDSGHYLWTERVGESQLEVTTCVDVCPKGFHGDVTSSSCQSCPSYCIECDSHDFCTSCTLDFAQPISGQCPQPCHEGEYFDFQTSHCLSCLPDCLTCRDSETCLACQSSFYLIGGASCVEVCPEHLVEDEEEGICRSETCHESCQTCFGEEPDQCLTCRGDGVLMEHSCVEVCPGHTYYDEASSSCRHCHESCRSCAGPSQDNCLACPEGALLSHFSCVSSCPEGSFVLNETECVSCPANCRECSGPGTCTLCLEGYLREGGECVESCSEGFAAEKDGLLCKRCPPGCKECSRPSTCEACQEGRFLYKPDHSCLTQCPSGYYPSEGSTCTECPAGCSECSGPSKSQCTVCGRDTAMVTKTHTCTPCCDQDHPETVPCCDCDADHVTCILKTTHPTTKSHESNSHRTGLVVTLCILVATAAIVLGIGLYYATTRLRRSRGVSYKPLRSSRHGGGELAATLALVEESESGSEAELFAKAIDT